MTCLGRIRKFVMHNCNCYEYDTFALDMEPLPDWVFEYAKQVKSSDLRSLMLLSDAGYELQKHRISSNRITNQLCHDKCNL